MGPQRSLILVAALGGIAAVGALAQPAPDAAKEQGRRLLAATADSRAAAARAAALERQAAGERDQAARARAQEQAAAERIKAAEADLAAARARIAILDRLVARQRSQLNARQGPVLRLVAALQAMARRPAMLAIAQPGSTQDMVHVRAVLATMVPAMQARTADVRAELDKLAGLRAAATRASDALRQSSAALERQRLAAVELEARHRLRSEALGRSAMDEADRALALGEQARDIAGQIAVQESAAQVQAALVGLPGPLPRPGAADAGPAAGAAPYRLPVAGRLVTGFGTLSDAGVRARGLTFAVAPGAPVTAPAPGTIAFAGPFRGYRGVVIVDHGKGWTSLVSGLAVLRVRAGAHVDAGTPLGTAPAKGDPRITVELRRRGQPMDLTQLLD